MVILLLMIFNLWSLFLWVSNLSATTFQCLEIRIQDHLVLLRFFANVIRADASFCLTNVIRLFFEQPIMFPPDSLLFMDILKKKLFAFWFFIFHIYEIINTTSFTMFMFDSFKLPVTWISLYHLDLNIHILVILLIRIPHLIPSWKRTCPKKYPTRMNLNRVGLRL